MVYKVLLADDSATIQKLVEMALSDSDFHLLAVSDGKQAVDRLGEFQPDIILADAIMPELNGYEVCQYVKGNPAFKNIPVILLTGRFQPFNEEKADLVGVDKRVVKPFSQDQLVSAMTELIERAAAQTVSASPPAADEPAEETFSVDEPDDFTIDDSEDSFTLPQPDVMAMPAALDEPKPEPEPEPEPEDASFFDERATIQANPEELKARLKELQPDSEDIESDTPGIDAFSLDSEPSPAPKESEPVASEEPMELHTEDLEEYTSDDLDDDEFSDFKDDELLDDDLEGLEDDELELSDSDMMEPPPSAPSEPTFPEATQAEAPEELPLEDSDDELQLDEPADELGFDDELLSGDMSLDNDQIEELDDSDFAREDPFASNLPSSDADDDTQPVPRESTSSPMADYDRAGDDDTLSLNGPEDDDEVQLVLDDYPPADEGDMELSLEEYVPPTEDDTQPGLNDEVSLLPDPEEEIVEDLDDELDLSADELEMETLDDIEPMGDDLTEQQAIHSDADTLEVSGQEMEEIREISRSQELSEDDFDLDLDLDLEDEQDDVAFEVEEVDEPLIPDFEEEVGTRVAPPAPEPPLEESLASDDEALEFSSDSSDYPTEKLDDPVLEDDPTHEESDVLEVEEPIAAVADPAPVAIGEISLSDAQMDDLAKRVTEHLVKSVGSDFVREVVWQVIPELSEAMIKKRIYQLEQSVEDQ